MDLFARLRAAKVHTAPFADVVRAMRQLPVEMADLGVAPAPADAHTALAADLSDMLRKVKPETVLKACVGIGGVQVTSSGTVFRLVVKGVHPDIYMHPMRMTPEQMAEDPLPAKYLKLAAVDAALCNSEDVPALWNGAMHTFGHVPKMHTWSTPALEADIRHAKVFAKYRLPLAELPAAPSRPSPPRRWSPYPPKKSLRY